MQLRKVIGKVLEKFFYLKLCYNRTHSYIGIPVDLVRDFGLITMWLKLYMPKLHLTYIIFLFFLALVCFVIWGHIDIKNKFAHIEISVNNKINPELMSIYKKVNNNDKTTD